MFMSLKIKKTFFLIACFIVLIGKGLSQTYFPPKTGTWDTLSIQRFGYCQERIDSLYNFLEKTNSKSFILLVNGKIVLEKYFGSFTKDSNWYWASAGKTLTGFCVGIAQAEGKLSLSDKSSKYLGTGWTSLSQSQEDSIKIWNQITMTTGLRDDVTDPDCTLPSCLQYKGDAGNRWAYHNAPYTLLDKVIESATGTTLNLFVYQKIANPIGMKGLYFKSGYNNVYGSDSRSMARFGLLLLNKGKWNGSYVLSDTNYFYQMTHTSQNINNSYGFLTWLNGKQSFMLPQTQLVFPGSISVDAPDDTYMALGKNGQVLNVVPSKNMVWMRMGNPPGDNGSIPPLYNNDIWKYINALSCNTNQSSLLEIAKNGLYPNPVPHGMKVIFNTQWMTLPQVYNSLGQKMKVQLVQKRDGFEIETANLKPGMYSIKQGNRTFKVLVTN